MYSIQKVSSSEATKLIELCVLESIRIGKQIAIAVSGPEGELIAFLRMDGASPAASRIARNKAYTSAVDRKDTREMGIFMRDMERPPAYWGDDGITGFGGGASVIIDGVVVGGVGVSGLSEEEDERIAKLAIRGTYPNG